jgi:hypothetical protein
MEGDMSEEIGRGRGLGPTLDEAVRKAHESITPALQSTGRRSLVVAFGMTSGGFTGVHEYYAEAVEVS